MKAWILLVNRAEAKFFQTDLRTQGEVEFVDKISNPKGRLKLGEIDDDRQGFSGKPGKGGRMERQQDPKDRIMQLFAKKVAHRLEDEFRRGRFEELVVISGPKFLGVLRQYMSKELSGVVIQEIQNNIINTGSSNRISDKVWSNSDNSGPLLDQGYLN